MRGGTSSSSFNGIRLGRNGDSFAINFLGYEYHTGRRGEEGLLPITMNARRFVRIRFSSMTNSSVFWGYALLSRHATYSDIILFTLSQYDTRNHELLRTITNVSTFDYDWSIDFYRSNISQYRYIMHVILYFLHAFYIYMLKIKLNCLKNCLKNCFSGSITYGEIYKPF